jgi:hypothetical protein
MRWEIPRIDLPRIIARNNSPLSFKRVFVEMQIESRRAAELGHKGVWLNEKKGTGTPNQILSVAGEESVDQGNSLSREPGYR